LSCYPSSPLAFLPIYPTRFASEDIPAGAEITSWGIPFGIALNDIKAGDCLANLKVTPLLDPLLCLHPTPCLPRDVIREYG
jgi:hypothetical protein